MHSTICRFGRYVVVVSTQTLMLLTSIIMAFLTNFKAILAVRFISGASNILTVFILGGSSLIMYILCKVMV